jgi:hypothetical protein
MKEYEEDTLSDSFDGCEHFVVAYNRHVAENPTAMVDSCCLMVIYFVCRQTGHGAYK